MSGGLYVDRMINPGAEPQPAFTWVARVGSEGGPLLVCDAEAFAAWGGAVLSPDYELDPACDLARANAVLYPSDDDEFDAGLVRFGDNDEHTGLVWEMDGPGTAEVAASGDSLLVMRSWVRNTDAPRRFAAGPAARTAETSVADLVLTSGHVVVVWAPAGAAHVGPFTTASTSLDLDHMRGVGALTQLRPGRYEVACGSHTGARGRYAPEAEQYGPPVVGNDDDWSCRWIHVVPVRD